MSLTPMKYIVVGVAIFLFLLFVTTYSFWHTSDLRTLGEVEVMAQSASIGEMRVNAEDETAEYPVIDKEELVANMLATISTVQKDHDLKVRVSYVFLDEAGHVTEEDSKIRSIQMKVEYVKENGEVMATSEKRISIDELKK